MFLVFGSKFKDKLFNKTSWQYKLNAETGAFHIWKSAQSY